jgi:hypothetical protein
MNTQALRDSIFSLRQQGIAVFLLLVFSRPSGG